MIHPLVESQGAELVELQYGQPKRGRGILRLFVDRPGGITIEELARINRIVGGLLEVHDVIPGSYTLEVSSPGLTRALKKAEDYQRYAGRLVRVTTRVPWEGRQVHCGILRGLKDDQVCLQEGESVLCIPLGEIARARLDLDLKNIGKEG
jgi:ribosome maturation factor RimP